MTFITGGFTASEFIKQLGRNAAREAVDAFLQYIGLSDKISVDGVCDEQAIMDSQGGEMCHFHICYSLHTKAQVSDNYGYLI